MKKPFLFVLAIAGFSAVQALAADVAPATTAPAATAPAVTATPTPASTPAATPAKSSRKDRDWSLSEAREKAHKKIERDQKWADKLDKMTEADWAQYQKERHERKDKLSKMTPDERKAYWKQHRHQDDNEENTSSTPTAAPITN